MHDTASNPPSSSSTTSATCAPAPSTRTCPSWQRSPYENLNRNRSPTNMSHGSRSAASSLSQPKIAVFAAALAVIALKPPAAGIILIWRSWLPPLQYPSFIERGRSIVLAPCTRFRSLQSATPPSTARRRRKRLSPAMRTTVPAASLQPSRHAASTTKASPCVRCSCSRRSGLNPPRTPTGSPSSQSRPCAAMTWAIPPANPSRCRVWMSLGAKRRRAAPLPRSSTACTPATKSILKDPAAWTSQDAAFIRDGVDRAQSPLEYASWLLDECTWEQFYGDRDRALQIIASLDELKLTPLHKRRRDALAAALRPETNTEQQLDL